MAMATTSPTRLVNTGQVQNKLKSLKYETNDDEYETDLDNEGGMNDDHTDAQKDSSQVYIAACEKENLLPHTVITNGLSKPFLQLQYRSIGCKAMKPLCVALTNNYTVTVLDLEDTDLGTQGALYLAETLKSNLVIKHLNVANNHVGNLGIQAITDTLCHNTTVTHLNISGNKLSDNFGKSLALLLTDNDSIIRLHANYNSLRNASAEAIGRAMRENSSLEHLDLGWNCITGKGALSLCYGLQKNTALKALDLSWNGVGYEGGVALSELLRKNRSLRYIDVSNTRVMWQNAPGLAQAFRRNVSLQVLKMGGNPLTTTGTMAILEAISDDKCCLQMLDLTDVPVVAEFHLLGAAIQKIRPFQFIHGDIVNSHDLLGSQVLGTAASGTGMSIKHPMQVVLEFVRSKQIRLLELFRSMDKSVLMKMSDKAFTKRLKMFGLPLHEHEIKGLVRHISRKGSDKTEITYLKLVKSVADHMSKERTRRSKLEEEKAHQQTLVKHSSTQFSVKYIKEALPKLPPAKPQ